MGPRHHPRRRSTDVAPSADRGERRTGQRRHHALPLQAIPAGHNPFVAAIDPIVAYSAVAAHRRRLDDILATVAQHREEQLHLYLVTAARGAGKTTAARGLAEYWHRWGTLFEPRMSAVRLLAPAPSLFAAVRLAWWAEGQAASARVDAAYRAEERWRESLVATRARLLMGMPRWPYPAPDFGWALAVVLDDAHGIGRRRLGALCRGLDRVAHRGAPIHLVLIGSSALSEIIPSTWARQVRGRWAIAPYDTTGLAEIVGVHLPGIDGARDALDGEAYEALHRLSAGLPAPAVGLCARALERARAEGSARIAPRHLIEQGHT